MTNCKVRIRYLPATDHVFTAAVQEACAAAALAGVDIDLPEAAGIAEEHLRSLGYPDVEIRLFRTVDEYRNRETNWVVRRDRAGHVRGSAGPRGAPRATRPATPNRRAE